MLGLVLGLLALWLAVALGYRLLALSSLSRQCAPEDRRPGERLPAGAVTAVRPLHGSGPWLEGCLDSLWRAAKAGGTRVVVGFRDPDDPAADVVARVQERWPETPAEVRIGPGPAGFNRKVSNQIQMTNGVASDFWLLSDADVRVPDDYVARSVRPFQDPGVGLVTCPYVSVAAPGAVSRIDALVTNTHFIPNACLAVRFEGLHFGLGATIAVRDTALRQIGGFPALLPLAADDYWLARKVEEAGWRLAWVPMVVEHTLAREGLRAVWDRHVRWARVTRDSRPAGYWGSMVTHGAVPALLLGASLAAWSPLGWAVPAAYWALHGFGLWRRRDLVRLRARDLALLPVVDLAAFAVFLAGLRGRARPS